MLLVLLLASPPCQLRCLWRALSEQGLRRWTRDPNGLLHRPEARRSLSALSTNDPHIGERVDLDDDLGPAIPVAVRASVGLWHGHSGSFVCPPPVAQGLTQQAAIGGRSFTDDAAVQIDRDGLRVGQRGARAGTKLDGRAPEAFRPAVPGGVIRAVLPHAHRVQVAMVRLELEMLDLTRQRDEKRQSTVRFDRNLDLERLARGPASTSIVLEGTKRFAPLIPGRVPAGQFVDDALSGVVEADLARTLSADTPGKDERVVAVAGREARGTCTSRGV